MIILLQTLFIFAIHKSYNLKLELTLKKTAKKIIMNKIVVNIRMIKAMSLDLLSYS